MIPIGSLLFSESGAPNHAPNGEARIQFVMRAKTTRMKAAPISANTGSASGNSPAVESGSGSSPCAGVFLLLPPRAARAVEAPPMIRDTAGFTSFQDQLFLPIKLAHK